MKKRMTGLPTTRELLVKCDLKHLKTVREFVGSICRDTNVREEIMHDLQLAANEVAANIMRHAFAGDSAAEFNLSATVTPTAVELAFRHDGLSFDPDVSEIRPPQFDGTQENGFGLFLIDKVIDRISYHNQDNGTNRIILIRRLL